MKTKITNKQVLASKAKAVSSGQAIYLWDTELGGFGAYLSPKGTVSWLVQKWQGGKANRIAIGRHPSLSLDEAKRVASPIINDAYSGIDISDRKRRQRIALKDLINAPTLGQVVERFLEENSTGNRYWKETAARLEHKLIEPLGRKTRVSDVTKEDLKPLVANGHVGNRHLYTTLRPFFKWCMAHDLIKADPLATIPAPKAFKARDRVLSDDEIKALLAATEKLGYPYSHFYQFLLLTGQRRDEVAKISWKEIDGDVWTIPKERTKNGKEHIVHLSKCALKLINSLPDIAKRREYLFTVLKGGGKHTISAYSKTKRRLDRLMTRQVELQDWRIHDLRRTAASGMARLGTSPHIIEKVLNHNSRVNSGLTAVYQRYEYQNERKEALEAWGRYVKELTRPSSGDPDTQEILKLISSQLSSLSEKKH